MQFVNIILEPRENQILEKLKGSLSHQPFLSRWINGAPYTDHPVPFLSLAAARLH